MRIPVWAYDETVEGHAVAYMSGMYAFSDYLALRSAIETAHQHMMDRNYGLAEETLSEALGRRD